MLSDLSRLSDSSATWRICSGRLFRPVDFLFSILDPNFVAMTTPSRGVPVGIESVVSILPDSMPILEATARVFRETETVESSEGIGTVQKLEHQGGDQGKVTIVGTADGEPRTVHLELTGADHSLAVDAYEQRILVKRVGELRRVRRSWILRNPRGSAVLAEAR